ncbi:MAG: hypothetical protein KC613_25620, partial [Myxococcales bacterium]|nr:hypothetical protein [Myxococcales bacterium]
GSANINDRGFKYEGEINAVVLDRAAAGDLRRRLMAEHLQLDASDPRVADVQQAFDLWEAQGEQNPGLLATGQAPVSHVHHFIQEAPARPPFGVGSGVF